MEYPGNSYIHYEVEKKINTELLKPEMDILLRNSSIDEVEDITIRDWFPVYHCGYYAVIGFTVPKNEFIMSEPIILVDVKRRYIRSPKKYYQLEGQFSIKTYEMFDLNFNFDCVTGLDIMSRKIFSDGLELTWIEDIFYVNLFISNARERDFNGYKTTINDSFGQIVEPHANHYIREKSVASDNMKVAIDQAYKSLRAGKTWKKSFIKSLRSNGYSHLVEKITKYAPFEPPKNRKIDRRTTRWLYLWRPEKRDENLSHFFITGKIFDDNHQFVDFSSRILCVNDAGEMIYTENGIVELRGPLCGLIYEKCYNLAEVYNLILNLIFGFSFKLSYWQDYVTIIDVVLRMDICAYRPARIESSQNDPHL